MAQNNNSNGTTGSNAGTTGTASSSTGSTGASGTLQTGGSHNADTYRPAGDTHLGQQSTTGQQSHAGQHTTTHQQPSMGQQSHAGQQQQQPSMGQQSTFQSEAQGYNEGRSAYQPEHSTAVTVTQQRRTASKPSRNMVIGSAVAGAVAGGVIPFMLSGRKSNASTSKATTGSVEVDASRSGQSTHADTQRDNSRSFGRRR